MYYPEMRKDCPMRGNLGNCLPVGGFCMDAVSDEICEAVHNAYYQGFHDVKKMLKMLKEQEAVEPISYMDGIVQRFTCGKCGKHLLYTKWDRDNYCSKCGQEVKWND